MSDLPRPEQGEYADFYERYIELVPDGDIAQTLMDQLGETLALLQSVTLDAETYRYAPDKWSIREVIGHLIDVERMMAFRAMNIARADGVALPGMDPDMWASNSNAHQRPLDDLSGEWAALRRANVHFFATLGPTAGSRSGIATGKPFTVRCFPWIIAGHELWHRALLTKDYGVSATAPS
jgi:hypothetical protein